MGPQGTVLPDPITDPEENQFPEDETPEDDKDDSEENTEYPKIDGLEEEDLTIYDKVISAIKTLESKEELSEDLCKCDLTRRISHLIKVYSEIQNLKPVNVELTEFTKNTAQNLDNLIQIVRNLSKTKSGCNHETNELHNLFRKVLDKKDMRPEEMSDFVN